MSYTPISWSNGDPITVQRLNQMSANDQFLYDRAIRSQYRFDNVPKTEGIKIWAGNARLPQTMTQRASTSVSWDGFFSPGCYPIVNVTLGRRDRNRVWISVKGPDAENWPNSRGCEIEAIVDPDAGYDLAVYMPLHIIAIGY